MQAADWTGRVGQTWADEWRRTDRSFAGLDRALEAAILAVAPTGPARLVDLGCGAGATSLAVAAARSSAELVGIDLSPQLIAVADERRARAGIDPVRCRFILGDAVAAIGAFAPIDLFFSRHGVMFFDKPVEAFARFAAAAAPCAALVFSCFAALAENKWATAPAGALIASTSSGQDSEPGPFAFADPARVGAILAAAGWRAAAPECVAFRYVAGSGTDPVGDAVGFFQRIGPAARALREAPPPERAGLLARLTDTCARRLERGEVAFPAVAWLWTAHKEIRR